MMARAMKSVFAIAGILLSCATVSAQQETLVIRGGRVHTMVDETPIDNGTVVIRNGRIAAVGGPDTAIPAGAQVIDASQMHVYPGFFDAVTRLGLTEIGAVAVTSDFRELGDNNPQLRGATAVHPASEILPVSRSNGLTHAVAAPQGPGIAGQGSLIHLDGWTVEEMLINGSVYMAVQWPTVQTRGRDRETRRPIHRTYREAKELYDQSIADLEALLADARRYAAVDVGDDATRRNLKLEALAWVANGDLPMLINVNTERGIGDAIDFSERNDVRIIIAGGRDAWKVAEMLAARGVPVILGPTQSLPGSDDDPYDAPYAAPATLQAAGVEFAISTFNASAARTLPYEAAQAVPFGLSHHDALRAITINPAEILGVGDQLGTIEVGKLANLFVSDGDPLETTTQIEQLVIAGLPVDPRNNKHDRLYQRYSGRPRPTGDPQ